MRGISIKIFFIGCLFFCAACSKKIQFVEQQQIQLSNPIIESDSTFFTQDLAVKMLLGLENAEIRYTLDDSEPTEASDLYFNGLTLTKSAHIKARAFHSDYLPSETVSTQFIKTNASNLIQNIKLNREVHENYQGTGLAGLRDYVKGSTDYKSKAWLGFAGGDLEIVIKTADNERVRQLVLSLLSYQSAWIFLPESVEVYTANQEKDYTLAAAKNIIVTEENSEDELRFIEVNFSEREVNHVKVILKNIKEIPAWHPGKGTPPWLFIDEVLLK